MTEYIIYSNYFWTRQAAEDWIKNNHGHARHGSTAHVIKKGKTFFIVRSVTDHDRLDITMRDGSHNIEPTLTMYQYAKRCGLLYTGDI